MKCTSSYTFLRMLLMIWPKLFRLILYLDFRWSNRTVRFAKGLKQFLLKDILRKYLSYRNYFLYFFSISSRGLTRLESVITPRMMSSKNRWYVLGVSLCGWATWPESRPICDSWCLTYCNWEQKLASALPSRNHDSLAMQRRNCDSAVEKSRFFG